MYLNKKWVKKCNNSDYLTWSCWRFSKPIDITFDRLSEKPCQSPMKYVFFLQFQFPLSTICQCFAWFFANGCDEYLSICVFQHTHSKCCRNHKIPGKVLKLICWCEFLGQNFLELERLTAGGDKGEISLSKVLSERFSLTSSSSILQLQPNFYSSLISYSSIHPFPIYYSSLKIHSSLFC